MRVCNVCKINKDLVDYHKCKRFPLGIVYTCKACAKAKTKIWNASEENKLRKKETNLRHYEANKEAYIERAKSSLWAKNNKERVRESARLRYSKDPDIYVNSVLKRRKYYKQATPPWLSDKHKAQIVGVYRVRSRVSKTTGKMHHVDHIVPLRGENVCGLHVPWNLRVITAEENITKGNKWPEWY